MRARSPKAAARRGAHRCSWRYGYAPGEGYRFCACGAVEAWSPDGRPSRASKALAALARRVHGLPGGPR